MKKRLNMLVPLISTILVLLSVVLFYVPNIKVTGNFDELTNKNVTITVESNHYQYSFNDEEYSKSNTFVINKNSDVKIKVKNFFGITREKTIKINNIDQELPTINNIKKYYLDNKLTTIIEAEDTSGIKEYIYEVDNKTHRQKDNEFVIEDITKDFTIQVVDNAGNIKEISKDYFKPTNLPFEVIKSTNDITNQNIVLTVISNYNLIDYSFNNDSYTSENTYTATSNQLLNIKVKDNQNQIYTQEIEIQNIDKEAPTLTYIKEIFNDTVTIILESNDNIELAENMYSIDNKEWTNKNALTLSANIDNLSIYVKDKAGNINKTTVKVDEIGKNLPKPEFKVQKSPSTITNRDIAVTVLTDDENLISFDNQAYSNKKTIYIKNNIENYSIKVKNNIGVVKEEIIKIDNIDKIPPTISYTQSSKQITVNPINITLSSDDNIGLPEKRYSWNNEEWTNINIKTFTSNVSNYNVRVIDNAGNISELTFSITNIDKPKTIKEKNQDLINDIYATYGFYIYYGANTSYSFHGECKKLIDENKANIALTEIKKVLPTFPQGFFEKFINKTGYEIFLFDDIPGNIAGLSIRETNGKTKIVLDINSSPLSKVLYHETYHMIDFLLDYLYYNKTYPYDNWNSFNPSGFTYGNTSSTEYTIYDHQATPNNTVFISQYSKTNDREDRAEIFAELMYKNTRSQHMNEGYGTYEKAKFIVNTINQIWDNPNARWNRWMTS